MKPTSQISRQPGRLTGERSPARARFARPLTDHAFHPSATEVQPIGGSRHLSKPLFAPGFREVSNQFLGAETKRSYVAEVLFFAIIVAVSAWPMVSVVQALSYLTR